MPFSLILTQSPASFSEMSDDAGREYPKGNSEGG